MTGKNHMLFGAALSFYVLPKLGISTNIITTAAASVGALVPDIDHPGSKINKIMLPIKNRLGKMMIYSGIGSFLIYKYKGVNSLVFLGIIMIIIGLSHHRSFTHSILGTILLSVVSFMVLQNYLSYNLIIAFITGIISHLMADYLTKQGIELFYPVSNKNYKFFITFSSGGTAESLLSLIFIFMIIKNFLVSV